MNNPSQRRKWIAGLAALAALVTVSSVAQADGRSHDNRHPPQQGQYQRHDRDHHGPAVGRYARREPPRHYEYRDTRWRHGYVYPRRGYVVPTLPRRVTVVRYRDRRYWYGGGAWYAPRGPRFVVVAPPVGVFVSLLPDYYTTVWFGGMPYYYANDAYYVWRARQRAYEVVEAPSQAASASVPPAAEELYVYPAAGQSQEQTARDRYECHRWAADETGFDPTRPVGGVPSGEADSLHDAYQRAMTACLEGRGYSVR